MPFPKPKPFSKVVSKPVEFMLEDFLPLPKSKVTMLSAGGGTGKTFLLIQAAIKYVQKHKDQKVLLWLSEDTIGESRDRAESIVMKIMNLERNDTGLMLENIDIVGSEEMAEYINDNTSAEAMKLFTPYSLVVLDPLIGFYEGEENNNTQAKRFMSHLTRIATINLQSIVLIHHHGKADGEGNSKTRGAQAFIDASRLLYELCYDKENDKHIVKIVKDNVGAKKFFGESFERKVLPYSVVVEAVKDNMIEISQADHIRFLDQAAIGLDNEIDDEF